MYIFASAFEREHSAQKSNLSVHIIKRMYAAMDAFLRGKVG
jgi:hypothetical protein